MFSRTKHGANRIAEYLLDQAGIGARRSTATSRRAPATARSTRFKRGDLRVLVATDIAARGIDVDGVTHVINFDLPNVPETYVHRIGRTARAGASGIALSFCDSEERAFLVDIERLMRRHIDRVDDHDYPPSERPPGETDLNRKGGGGGSKPAGRGGGGGGGGAKPAAGKRRSSRGRGGSGGGGGGGGGRGSAATGSRR